MIPITTRRKRGLTAEGKRPNETYELATRRTIPAVVG